MKRRTRLSAFAATIAVLATTPAVVGLQADADPKPKVNDPGYDILFVRHAKSVYPVPEEELNALGIQQAAKLVEYLHDAPIRSVDSSKAPFKCPLSFMSPSDPGPASGPAGLAVATCAPPKLYGDQPPCRVSVFGSPKAPSICRPARTASANPPCFASCRIWSGPLPARPRS